jgi:hypothetical protein
MDSMEIPARSASETISGMTLSPSLLDVRHLGEPFDRPQDRLELPIS